MRRVRGRRVRGREARPKMVLFIFLVLALFLQLGGCSSAALRKKEKKADIYYAYGSAHLVKKNYTEALDFLLKAYRLRPDDSKILNNLGMAYYFKNQLKLAIKFIKQALAEKKDNSSARNNLASIYYQQGKIDQAETEYHTVLEDLIYKHQYRIHYNLALIALLRGHTSSAEEHLTLSLKEKEDYCPAQFKLGELAKKKRLYQKAYTHFYKASLGICYSEPAPHYEQALVLIKLNKYNQAYQKLQQIKEKFTKGLYRKLALRQIEKISPLVDSQEAFLPLQTKLSPLREQNEKRKLLKVKKSKLKKRRRADEKYLMPTF